MKRRRPFPSLPRPSKRRRILRPRTRTGPTTNTTRSSTRRSSSSSSSRVSGSGSSKRNRTRTRRRSVPKPKTAKPPPPAPNPPAPASAAASASVPAPPPKKSRYYSSLMQPDFRYLIHAYRRHCSLPDPDDDFFAHGGGSDGSDAKSDSVNRRKKRERAAYVQTAKQYNTYVLVARVRKLTNSLAGIDVNKRRRGRRRRGKTRRGKKAKAKTKTKKPKPLLRKNGKVRPATYEWIEQAVGSANEGEEEEEEKEEESEESGTDDDDFIVDEDESESARGSSQEEEEVVVEEEEEEEEEESGVASSVVESEESEAQDGEEDEEEVEQHDGTNLEMGDIELMNFASADIMQRVGKRMHCRLDVGGGRVDGKLEIGLPDAILLEGIEPHVKVTPSVPIMTAWTKSAIIVLRFLLWVCCGAENVPSESEMSVSIDSRVAVTFRAVTNAMDALLQDNRVILGPQAASSVKRRTYHILWDLIKLGFAHKVVGATPYQLTLAEDVLERFQKKGILWFQTVYDPNAIFSFLDHRAGAREVEEEEGMGELSDAEQHDFEDLLKRKKKKKKIPTFRTRKRRPSDRRRRRRILARIQKDRPRLLYSRALASLERPEPLPSDFDFFALPVDEEDEDEEEDAAIDFLGDFDSFVPPQLPTPIPPHDEYFQEASEYYREENMTTFFEPPVVEEAPPDFGLPEAGEGSVSDGLQVVFVSEGDEAQQMILMDDTALWEKNRDE